MKKWGIIISGLLIVALCYYLFLMEGDYRVRFKANTVPGVINQTMKTWSASLDQSTLVSQESWERFEQEVQVNDHIYQLRWEVEMIDDSTSAITVNVTEPGNSLKNRIAIPFADTPIEEHSALLFNDFYEKLNEHLENFKVSVDGKVDLKKLFCVYLSIKSDQLGKAQGMMQTFDLLTSFIVDNGLEPDGVPIVEVTNWDTQTDELSYDFCYPIKKADTLPESDILGYRSLGGGRAIKATYYGNYITSDRAWYALLHYADQQDLKVALKPVEVFYDNPSVSGNDKEWRAEIYLPLEQLTIEAD